MSFGMFFVGRDLPVQRLGFGTAALVGSGYWGPREFSDGDAVTLLKQAVHQGVDLIDTADNYGPDLAEELIAEALHPYPMGLHIATKGGVVRTSATEWHIDGRPESLRAAAEGSLRRLKLDTIDLYQLHRIDPQVPLSDQLGALAELREEGKIRHIGLDTVTVEQVHAALEITEIVSVQNRFNLLDRESAKVVELCEVRDLAFFPWFPLGNGALTGDANKVVNEIAAEHGATAAQVSLAWLLSYSRVIIATPGTSSQDHLDENLAAARLDLSAEALAKLNALTR